MEFGITVLLLLQVPRCFMNSEISPNKELSVIDKSLCVARGLLLPSTRLNLIDSSSVNGTRAISTQSHGDTLQRLGKRYSLMTDGNGYFRTLADGGGESCTTLPPGQEAVLTLQIQATRPAYTRLKQFTDGLIAGTPVEGRKPTKKT